MRNDDLGFYRAPGRSFYATLVPFPIACFVGTFLTDLAYMATDSVIWETFSVWLLTIGLVVAALAVRRVRGLGRPWMRVVGEFVAFGLALLNVFVHSRDGYTAVVPEGIILTVLVLIVTLFVGRPVNTYRTEGLT